MTIYFAGTELDAVSACKSVSTVTGDRNTEFSRTSLDATTTSRVIVNPGVAVESSWWVHALVVPETLSTSVPLFRIKDPSGNIIVDTVSNSGGYITFALLNSALVPTNTNSWGSTLVSETKMEFDIHVYTSEGNAMLDVYSNGALVASATIIGQSHRPLGSVELGSTGSSYNSHWSEIIIADEDTRGMHVLTAYPTANGTYTNGVGSYTDIDESAATGTDLITLSAVGNKQSWVNTKVSAPNGALFVRAICQNGLVASDNSNDMRPFIRIGTTDYSGGNLNLNGVAKATCTPFNTNPATGQPWGTLADLPSMEFGFEVV